MREDLRDRAEPHIFPTDQETCSRINLMFYDILTILPYSLAQAMKFLSFYFTEFDYSNGISMTHLL